MENGKLIMENLSEWKMENGKLFVPPSKVILRTFLSDNLLR